MGFQEIYRSVFLIAQVLGLGKLERADNVSAIGQQSGQRVEDAVGVGRGCLPSAVLLLLIDDVFEA